MFRRVSTLAVIAAISLATALSACGDDDSPSSGGEGGARGAKVTMILGVRGDEGYLTDACGAKDIAKRYDIDLDVQAPQEFDPAQQTEVLDSVIAKKPDAILIAPTDVKAMIAPILRATEAGIKVVLFDTTLEDTSMVESVVGVDNAEGGRLAAQTLAELIGGKGKVLVNNVQPGISTTDAREQGFEDGIKSEPDIEYLGAQYNEDSPEKAAAIVTSTLAAHPDLAGIFATNLFSAEGSVTGLRNAGRVGKVKLVAFDATPAEVEALREGTMQALIAQELRKMGQTGMRQVVQVLNGDPVQKEVQVGFRVITQDNIDEPASREAFYKATC